MTVERARRVLLIEARAIEALAQRLGEDFVRAVDLLLACSGKVIVMGMGKSGLIGRKVAATLASTGTPAFFIHPAEGVHGAVGMIDPKDLALFISNSGETEELLKLLPAIKRLGVPVIGLVGVPGSTLAHSADVVLDVSVAEEACPLRLAPTSSTTVALAMGDALALAALERRGFTEEDFARLHPAGALGRKLLLRVSDLMVTGPALPVVGPDAGLREVIIVMSSKLLGHTAVVDGQRLLGVISDGDLRRAMEKDDNFMVKKAREIMTARPKWVRPEELAASALQRMERHSITALIVSDDDTGERLTGIIHLHHLLRAGVV